MAFVIRNLLLEYSTPSLFIDLTFRFPNREASSAQFLAMLPLQLQRDKWEEITAEDR